MRIRALLALAPLLLLTAVSIAVGQDGHSALAANALPSRSNVSLSTSNDWSTASVATYPSVSAPWRPANPISFRQMVMASGIVFSGTVTSISRQEASETNPVGTVSITFHVDRALRGVGSESFTLKEWIALWRNTGQTYRVGEKVLLFLYPKSKLGLSSCVRGTLGRFRVDRFDRVLFSPEHRAAFRSDPVLAGKLNISIWDFVSALQHAEAPAEERAR